VTPRSWYPDDTTGRVLALMAEHGFHMDRPMEINFHVVAPTERAAEEMAEEARARGHRAEVYDSPKCRLPWTCECTVVMVPTYHDVIAAENEFDAIGRQFGGFGDGFGSLGDIRNN
jgi:hypothetical protein